jgi:hypothetical protein
MTTYYKGLVSNMECSIFKAGGMSTDRSTASCTAVT